MMRGGTDTRRRGDDVRKAMAARAGDRATSRAMGARGRCTLWLLLAHCGVGITLSATPTSPHTRHSPRPSQLLVFSLTRVRQLD